VTPLNPGAKGPYPTLSDKAPEDQRLIL
jgi:hypothetical protein